MLIRKEYLLTRIFFLFLFPILFLLSRPLKVKRRPAFGVEGCLLFTGEFVSICYLIRKSTLSLSLPVWYPFCTWRIKERYLCPRDLESGKPNEILAGDERGRSLDWDNGGGRFFLDSSLFYFVFIWGQGRRSLFYPVRSMHVFCLRIQKDPSIRFWEVFHSLFFLLCCLFSYSLRETLPCKLNCLLSAFQISQTLLSSFQRRISHI